MHQRLCKTKCSSMFIAAPFIVARKLKEFSSLSTEGTDNKNMIYLHKGK